MSLDITTFKDREDTLHKTKWRRRLRSMLDLCKTEEEIWNVGNEALRQVGHLRYDYRVAEDRAGYARMVDDINIYSELEQVIRKLTSWSQDLNAYRDTMVILISIANARIDPAGFVFGPTDYEEEWDHFEWLHRPERLEGPECMEEMEFMEALA